VLLDDRKEVAEQAAFLGRQLRALDGRGLVLDAVDLPPSSRQQRRAGRPSVRAAATALAVGSPIAAARGTARRGLRPA